MYILKFDIFDENFEHPVDVWEVRNDKPTSYYRNGYHLQISTIKKCVDVPAEFWVAILATQNQGQNHGLLAGR